MLKKIFGTILGTAEKPPAPTPLVSSDNFEIRYELKLGDMYTEAERDLREVIANGHDPNPTTEKGLSLIFREAQRWIKAEDWDLVCLKWSTAPANHMRRSMILDLLRRWWTERRKVENNQQPIYIHLLKDEGWED